MDSSVEKKKVLVTGGAGFIGSRVVRKFLNQGYLVVVLDDLSTGKEKNLPNDIEFIQAAVQERGWHSLLKGRKFEAVLHLAGQSSGEISFDDPIYDLDCNTGTTLSVLEFCKNENIRRMVFASSMAIYGSRRSGEDNCVKEDSAIRPQSYYAANKYASELNMRVFAGVNPGFSLVALRLFSTYGPGQDMENLRQGMVSIFLAQALKSGKIGVRGGLDRTRDFVFVEDIAEAFFRAGTRLIPEGFTVANVGTGHPTRVQDLLDSICQEVPGSRYEVLGITPGDIHGICASTDHLKALLDFVPQVTIFEGLKQMANWAKQTK